jgi:hypothetical protein
MEARFEDILHLVSWNGYTEEIRQAVAVNKDTWTDERIWFPFLIRQRYGSKQKGRFQILAENKNQFSNDDRLMARYTNLKMMAENSYGMKHFRDQIDVRDTEGESALTAAINKKCEKAVKFLVEHGADINQTNKKGRSALNFAKSIQAKNNDEMVQGTSIKKRNGTLVIATVKQKRSENIVSYLIGLGAVDIPEEEGMNRRFFGNNFMYYEDMFNLMIRRFVRAPQGAGLQVIQPEIPTVAKSKRLKSALYKQQFGRR